MRGLFTGGAGAFSLTYRIESAIIKGEWGYDELVKRIPCRVIRSVPLNRGDAVSRAGRGDGVGSGDIGLGAADMGFECSSDSRGWLFGPDAVKAPFGESATELALDFLA